MESALTAIDDPVLYLYGILRRSDTLPPLEGIEPGSTVFLVPSGALACAASVVSARVYQQPRDGNTPEQAEWITTRAWQHHEILRRLHETSAVLPLKFGATSPSADSVEKLLGDLRETITDLLRRFDGKDEWTLRMRADEGRLRAELQHTSPVLIALMQGASGLPDGRAYFARKRLAAATTDAVSARLSQVEEAVYQTLAARDIELIPLQQKNVGQDAAPFASTALLVDRTRRDMLKDALVALEDEHVACGLTFELVGPWPPYSFAGRIEAAPDR